MFSHACAHCLRSIHAASGMEKNRFYCFCFLFLSLITIKNECCYFFPLTDNETDFSQLQTSIKHLSPTVELKLNWAFYLRLLFVWVNVNVNQEKSSWDDNEEEEDEEEEEGFTIGRDEGEMLVLTAFSLPVADVEVDMDRSGESLVAVGRDLHQERSLEQHLEHFSPLHLISCNSWVTAESLQHNVKLLLHDKKKGVPVVPELKDNQNTRGIWASMSS